MAERTLIVSAPRGSGGSYTHLSRVVPRLIGLMPSWRVEVHAPRSVLRECFDSDAESWMRPYDGENYAARLRWEFLELPRLLAREPRALLWAPFGPPLNVRVASRTMWMSRNVLPLVSAREREVSVADQPRIAALRRIYVYWTHRARRTICVSLHARERLARLVGSSPALIPVIPHGVDPRGATARCSTPELENLRARPYVLHVGQPVGYRRTRELCEAYCGLASKRADLPPLLLAGSARPADRSYEQRCIEALAALAQSGRAHVLGQVAHDDVLALMGTTHTFVYPSVQENCPNIVLEALSAGRVGIYADIEAVRELAGDAAVFVDAPSALVLEAALERAVFDETLRAKISGAAGARASLFTWDTCATTTARVIEDAAI